MRCITVDDEPKALYVIEHYIGKTPLLQLEGAYRDALQALEVVKTKPLDLMFLDINMPDISGIQFLRSLPNPPMVIFTTAYTEYAIKSYELQAVDYLLKPIEFDRFLMAVNRAHDLYKLKNQKIPQVPTLPAQHPSTSQEQPYLFIKSGQQTYKVNLNDILYVEGSGNYVAFVTKDRKILSHLTMSEAVALLPAACFHRVHRSFVINLRHIVIIDRSSVTVHNKEIPVGGLYREGFQKRVEQAG